MNYIEKQIHKFDELQQKHPGLGFIYAVIKKYGDDQAAYQAALITYYGFLSLFPLLIVVTTLLKLIFGSHSHLRERVLSHLSQYVPILGNELQQNVHSIPKAGLGLIVTLLITLYGAQGVAGAFKNALDHIWLLPRRGRPGFPNSTIKNLQIILLGGAGVILAGLFSGYAASLGRSGILRITSSIVSFIILLIVLFIIFRVATFRKISDKNLLISALTAAIGLQILQSIGGYIITHELKHSNSLYGVFAIVLGLLFWIYLQAQVVLYAVEAGSVKGFRLWPRSIDQNAPTSVDRLAYELYAKRDHLAKP